MLYIDATQIRMFLDCRESYRLAYIENRASKKPALAREFGIAIHLGVEAFWQGKDFPEALAIVSDYMSKVNTMGCTPEEDRKWREMNNYAPDLLACYYDNVEYGDKVLILNGAPMTEHEWKYESPFGIEGLTLCGRIDRYERGYRLVDLKTASEIGKNWKADYKNSMLRDVGLSLYDWYLCNGVPLNPNEIELEVLIKPYRDKATRFERVPMNEIIAYRKRFEQQLKWVLKEMKCYHDNFREAYPWPMAQGQCVTKFGPCQFLEGCNRGWSGKTLDKYKQRKEHLTIRLEQINGTTSDSTISSSTTGA